MLSSVTVKTVSARSKWRKLGKLIVEPKWLFAAALVVLVYYGIWHTAMPQVEMRVGNSVYHVWVATKSGDRNKGLGGRDRLAARDGMLFVYDRSDRYCFWMKDMRFPIDILWADEQRKVIQITKNVQPSTYPDTFCPEQPVRFVVELNVGEAARAGIHEGQSLAF